jgi:hypothetical protein
MQLVQVYLDQVTCFDTEDLTGADEFYVIGTIYTVDRRIVRPVATQPMDINDGQTFKFGPGGGYVFNEYLPDDAIVQLELRAFDEDAGSGAEKYSKILSYSQQVANQTALGAPLGLALDGIKLILEADQDDNLTPNHLGVIDASTPFGWTLRYWDLYEPGNYSSWSYRIQYWVNRQQM